MTYTTSRRSDPGLGRLCSVTPAGSGRVALVMVHAALFVLGGCGPRASSASGSVTYRGKPMKTGLVIMIGADGRATAPAAVQPDGTFIVPSAPTGSVSVAFDNPLPPGWSPPRRKSTTDAMAEKVEDAAERDAELRQLLDTAASFIETPTHYRDPDTSGITFELKPGHNPDCTIRLE